jgi:RNA polymerase sigma-70 factor (ECF subfamily)
MVSNHSDAEDVLQNSFLDVFTRLDSFRFESSIGAWIKRIVINNCINFLNKRRIRFDELDEHHIEIEEEATATDSMTLNVPLIHTAISELPEGYRVVLSLYLLEGYDHTEIAQILNISEATSKSQYSRARQRLKQIIQSNPRSLFA